MSAIPEFEQAFSLGLPAMDATHQEFVDQVNRLAVADNSEFAELYRRFFEHTKAHFAAEEAVMIDSGFPATGEHRAEHARVLGEMDRFVDRLQGIGLRMARAYVTEQLPSWFKLHLITMDSALVAHLANRRDKVSGL